MTRERLQSLGLGLGGVVLLVVVWWLAAATVLSGNHVPTPPEVITAFGDKGWDYYQRQFTVTIKEAATGFLYGVGAAFLLSVLVLLAPISEPLVMQVAVVTYCIPIVAVAPVLALVTDAPEPGQPSGAAVALAALSVFFTTVVGTVLGFKSADRTSLDVVTVYGGGRVQQLLRVQLVSAAPAIIRALQVAAPAAFLGAILGELFGGRIELGVGVALRQTQTSLDEGGAWSIGLGCALVAGLGYLAFGVLAKLATPWSRGVDL